MNYFFSHIPSDNWTDPAKKDEYDALGRENAKLRGQIAELEKKDLNDPAINTNKNLIIGYLKQMENLRKDYGPGRPQLQAPAPAPQPGKSCHFIHYFMVLIFFFFFFFFLKPQVCPPHRNW